ncbi:hypothetical protein Cal6303_4806 [Calothrix sp. PCC 6303]|nr:hypothetical protein Cal6303_4806 [Calothrix sp. PCC 6303]
MFFNEDLSPTQNILPVEVGELSPEYEAVSQP